MRYARPLEDIIETMRELPPLPREPVRDLESMAAFQGFVSLHASLLAEIHGQVRGIRSNLCSLSSEISNVQLAPQPVFTDDETRQSDLHEILDSASLLNHLLPSAHYDYALRLYSDFRSPIYKNKPFSLELKAIDPCRAPLVITSPLTFEVLVFKATLPLTEVTTVDTPEGREGTTFLTGQTRVGVANSEIILFRDLMFSDVTSNYPENWVFVVVKCVEEQRIKPLVLEGVRIKARKPIVSEM